MKGIFYISVNNFMNNKIIIFKTNSGTTKKRKQICNIQDKCEKNYSGRRRGRELDTDTWAPQHSTGDG
jgi:hypothetical protein